VAADPWTVLGLLAGASEEEIKRAFRRIARQSHPDVAGDDASASARFAEARRAYELLRDPASRARVDGHATEPARGSFFDAFYRRTSSSSSGLDDLVADFGTGSRRSAGRGGDATTTLDVPADVAAHGGTVEVRYRRRRSAGPAGDDVVDEVAPVRVAPGTTDGSVLRERGLGHAGDGGPGDLVVTVRVVPSGIRWLDVNVADAFLGGTVSAEGRTVVVPRGTSSGARLRVGTQMREVRIVAPEAIDEEAAELLRAFVRKTSGR
jgi:DnaJ-class molecular chaperone